MRLTVILPKTDYIVGEHRPARLILRNESGMTLAFGATPPTTPGAVRLTLIGPALSGGASAPWREVSSKALSHALAARTGSRGRLAPGQSIESTIALHDWLPVTKPGRYRLEASLLHAAYPVVSSPVEFDVLAPPLCPASLGCDIAGPEGSEVLTTWLQEVAGQRMLMTRVFHETRDGQSLTAGLHGAARALGAVAPGTSEALAPWSNDPARISSVSWLVWRNGASLMALAEPATMTGPFRFDLEEPPARLVRPPLQTAAGELFIPVISARGRELRLIAFRSASDATHVTPGWEIGRVRLRGAPVASRATLQPASLGNGVSVVLIEPSPHGLEVHHVRTSGLGRFSRVETTHLRGLSALPDSEPGLWIDASGRLRAAVLALSSKAPRQLVLAEVTHRPDGRLGPPARMTALGELPCAPRSALVRPHPALKHAGALTWAILLEDGRLLGPGTSGAPMWTRHPVSLPLELYLGQGAYILTRDPVRGPVFEPLRSTRPTGSSGG
ncbi:hypothetical protein LY474_38540 [Myxococcus stipitatus]|uniref:hypothetical protein n=1 Tax=Myxococcus stipitatus TaxID=83455 RepID=UPI001F200EC0|nr:hypothetical protein [Myxococcus stipitatus]MCE9673717.1 hypothetical protein [Myxococcus stipitatus]